MSEFLRRSVEKTTPSISEKVNTAILLRIKNETEKRKKGDKPTAINYLCGNLEPVDRETIIEKFAVDKGKFKFGSYFTEFQTSYRGPEDEPIYLQDLVYTIKFSTEQLFPDS